MLAALAHQYRLRFAVPGVGSEAEQAFDGPTEFTPHVSLVYSARASAVVPLQAALDAVQSAGIVIRAGDGVGEAEGAAEGGGEGGLWGWTGGRVVIVQTWKDLAEWTVLAERVL